MINKNNNKDFLVRAGGLFPGGVAETLSNKSYFIVNQKDMEICDIYHIRQASQLAYSVPIQQKKLITGSHNIFSAPQSKCHEQFSVQPTNRNKLRTNYCTLPKSLASDRQNCESWGASINKVKKILCFIFVTYSYLHLCGGASSTQFMATCHQALVSRVNPSQNT